MRWTRLLPLVVVALLGACSPPEPPTLTVKSARVVSIDMQGMKVRVLAEAYNPNRIDLSLQGVTGHVMLDGKLDMGTVTLRKPMTLIAGARTPLDVPLEMEWKDLGALAAAAATTRDIPYTVDGTATVGGGRLSATLPFKIQGTVTRQQLAQLAAGSLPRLPSLLPRK